MGSSIADGAPSKSRARVTAYQKLLDEEQNVKLDRVEIHIPPGPRLGDLVVAADGLAKSFGESLLFEDLSFSLPPGGIVGVVGPNGAGKTTLFRLIVGDEKPDAGEVRVETRSRSLTSIRRAPTCHRRTRSGQKFRVGTTRSRSDHAR